MNILCLYAKSEITVKGSQFIAEVFPVTSQQAAREKLREQKALYSDASHVVHAFFTGAAREVSGMSDDGEPPGTAGRPVLDILRGKDCTNILLTVTRYFGGTLLGTGGLVKAYGDAARAVLDTAEMEELIERVCFSVHIPYSLHDKVLHDMQPYHISALNETFETDIVMTGKIYESEKDAFQKMMGELSAGRAAVVFSSDC